MIKFFKNSKNSDIKRKIEAEEYKKVIDSLTQSELKVYDLVVQGYNVKEMNKRLNLKESTIKSYLKSIFKKLNVHSKVELIITYGSIYNSLNNINTMD